MIYVLAWYAVGLIGSILFREAFQFLYAHRRDEYGGRTTFTFGSLILTMLWAWAGPLTILAAIENWILSLCDMWLPRVRGFDFWHKPVFKRQR